MTTEFTAIVSLAGGVLIGMAAVLLMLVHGRIAGATGILTGIVTAPEKGWRIGMLAGMVAVPALLAGMVAAHWGASAARSVGAAETTAKPADRSR